MVLEPFHPDLRSVARWLPRAAVHQRWLKPIRMLSRLQPRPSKDVEVQTLGPISIRVHRPKAATTDGAALLWMHGGGYVMGAAAQDDATCRRFAETLRIVVAAVDYRLAPEHKFPTPLQDCYDALTWLAEHPEVDSARIAVGGASAGGGLAASLALLAAERAEVPVAFQLLTYPMLDDRSALRIDVDQRHFRLWNVKANRFGWESYTGFPSGSPQISPLAAPARYEDLSNLPPAWIGIGTLDLFYDEAVAYGRRLDAAGVSCQVEVIPGAFHGFDAVRPQAPVSRAFRDARSEALAAALTG